MPKYLIPEQQIPTDIKELVDRMGRIQREIKKRVSLFKKMRSRLLKLKPKGKVLGEDYKVLISQYEKIILDQARLKKLVPAATLKKCRTVIESTRITFTAR